MLDNFELPCETLKAQNGKLFKLLYFLKLPSFKNRKSNVLSNF